MKEYKRKDKIIVIQSIIIALFIVVGITFAVFNYGKAGTTDNKVISGTITMNYTSEVNGIDLVNAAPTNDDVGKELTGESNVFDFTVSLSSSFQSNYSVNYEVTAEDVTEEEDKLSNNDVRLYLLKSKDTDTYDTVAMNPSFFVPLEKEDYFGASTNEMVIDEGRISVNEIYYYRLKMWLHNNCDISNVAKSFTIRVNVYGTSKDKPTPVSRITNLVKDAPKDSSSVYTSDVSSSDNCTNTFMFDQTVDNNLRYVGKNPCNYIDIGEIAQTDIYYGYQSASSYNHKVYSSLNACTTSSNYNVDCKKVVSAGERILWRVIGIFNNIDDGTGKNEIRVKLIRSIPYDFLPWDKGSSDGGTHGTYGWSDWEHSTLKIELNGEGFYDNFSDSLKNKIGYTKWNVGGWSGNSVNSVTSYTNERGSTKYCGRDVFYVEKVGLLYPSDYGFASSQSAGGTVAMSNYSDSTYKYNDYLFDDASMWTLSPGGYFSGDYTVHNIDAGGYLDDRMVYISFGVFPSIYLKSSVMISGGSGSKNDPYTVS